MEGGSRHPERAEDGESRPVFNRARKVEAVVNARAPLSAQVLAPSPRNYGDVIAGAVEHGDAAAAWALYEELIGRELCPHEETWDALFKRIPTSQPEHQKKLLEILLYMRTNQIYPHYHLASTIKTWFERWSRLNLCFSLYHLLQSGSF